MPLEPLEAPAAGLSDVEVVGRSAAVQLLLARAEAVRPGFALTPANAAAVAELCRRLDGIPLALELAAVQLRILTPAALLTRLGAGLDRSLDLTAGPVDLPSRQRTLRATIEWSYGLLGAAQRVLLARLSVFNGAWTIEASEAVGSAGGDLDAVDTLAALVAQSLAPHSAADLLVEPWPAPDDPRPSREGGGPPIGGAPGPYASALLLGAQGMAMVVVGQTAEAEPLLARTLETATTLGNARLRAYALLGLGGALANRSAGEASQRLDDAAEAFRGTGDWWGLAITLSTRGQLALAVGDHAAAEAMHKEALAAAETVDNDYLRAQVLDMLGLDAATVGDVAGAWDRYSAAAALHGRLLDYEGSANCLSGLAGLALGQKKPRVAARLIGASGYARRIVGVAVWPGMQSMDEAQRAAVTAALSPASFAAATAEGARMRIPDALGYGLAATAAEQAADPFPAWALRLRAAT